MVETKSFADRLTKNLRHWGKWARRQGISCFRIYDRDIPEFPVVVDLYEQHAHLQEVETGYKGQNASGPEWLEALRQSVAEVVGLPLEAVIPKKRFRQRGTSQYEKLKEAASPFVVHEGGHRFLVNLEQYLDTGLFLDHRNTRRMVQEAAQGKRFLNLFAYTGSFTVYAAKGGAISSTTVDMSNTYLQWARRNFELNQLDLKVHELVRSDVQSFLVDAVARNERYDLIVMDPPSFSNSKRMEGTFDVQRDHAALIELCMALLPPQGILYFSTNRTGFVLDSSVARRYPTRDISRMTVPEDYRNKKIHACWLITKVPM